MGAISQSEAARDAAQRAACVIAGFFRVSPDDLFRSTRGSAAAAFPRQLLMAALVVELGFPPDVAGAAVGRTKDTVDHACRIVEAIRGGVDPDDLIEILGERGVDEFLGGADGASQFLAHAEALIDDLFAAFALVAIRGAAYCAELERQKQARTQEQEHDRAAQNLDPRPVRIPRLSPAPDLRRAAR